MAQFEDERVSEEETSLLEETILMSREISLGQNGLRRWVEDKRILG